MKKHVGSSDGHYDIDVEGEEPFIDYHIPKHSKPTDVMPGNFTFGAVGDIYEDSSAALDHGR